MYFNIGAYWIDLFLVDNICLGILILVFLICLEIEKFWHYLSSAPARSMHPP